MAEGELLTPCQDPSLHCPEGGGEEGRFHWSEGGAGWLLRNQEPVCQSEFPSSKLFSAFAVRMPRGGEGEARQGEGKQGVEIRRRLREGIRSVGARLLQGAFAFSFALRQKK